MNKLQLWPFLILSLCVAVGVVVDRVQNLRQQRRLCAELQEQADRHEKELREMILVLTRLLMEYVNTHPPHEPFTSAWWGEVGLTTAA